MTDIAKPVVLIEGTAQYLAAVQARHPEVEVMPEGTPESVLEGRVVRRLEGKPKTLKERITEFAKGKHYVAVQDFIDLNSDIGDKIGRRSFEIRIAKAMKAMGWKKVNLRDGPYRMAAYIPTVPLEYATPKPMLWVHKNRPRGNHVKSGNEGRADATQRK